MSIGRKSVYLLTTIMLTGFLAFSTHASTIVPSASPEGPRTLQKSSAEADYITLNKANTSGISVNVFSDFSVSGKPLRLLHGGIQDDNYQPAKLIIIKSPRISIAGTIELVGEAANVLFIDSDSTLTSTLSCTACDFHNFGRIMLASATSEYSINLNMSKVGKLSTFGGGAVSVNGLKTNGAFSLEIIAEKITSAGEIDTHIRGNIDSNGGYTVNAEGSNVVAVAGINLYLGASAVDYEGLNLAQNSSSATYVTEQVLGGVWKAAMINIMSNSAIRLASSAQLSTQSDMLATSMHQGEFNALLEGVYIQTTNESSGSVILEGKILTDNFVQVISQEDLRMESELTAYRSDLFAKNGVLLSSSGILNSHTSAIGSEWFSNRGSISVNLLNIETQKTLYNHFGGQISGDVVTLVSSDGAIVNGSRSNKLYMPNDLAGVHLDAELKGNDKYGLYQLIAGESGSTQSNLSGVITANSINIKAKRFENINPYSVTKPQDDTWDAGVPLDVAKSRRVAVLAETGLAIDASEYILNSSAIIGLNQAGSLDINTSLLMNQRYRIEASLAVYSKESFDLSGVKATSSKVNVNEIETYLTAYSPPGILYSFGALTFSDGIENNVDTSDFINQFSFLEVLSDAHFHDSRLHSLGLAMSARELLGFEPVRCAAYGCSASSYLSFIESETLTSFGGNVYGISSDLVIQTVNQLEDASKQAIIDEFVARRRDEVAFEHTYFNPTSVGGNVFQRHYLYKWEVVSNGVSEQLVLTINRCERIEYFSGNISSTCVPYTEQYDLQAMLTEEADGNLINGLPWTGGEVKEKAKAYIEGTSYAGVFELAGYSSISGTYVREYTINKVSDDRELIQIDYVQKFEPTNPGSLQEGESRAVGYYRETGSVTLRLEELMGSVVPNVPSGLSIAYVLSDNQVTYNISWNAVSQTNITYYLSIGGNTTDTTASVTRSVNPGNTSFNVKVKACNTVSCSDWSNNVTVQFQVPPSSEDLANCRSVFYNPFSAQFKMPFMGGVGNYCGITTKNGTVYYVIAEQRQAVDPGGNPYARCERVKYFNRDAVVSAILDDTSLPAVSFTEGSSTYYVDCKDYLSFSLYALE